MGKNSVIAPGQPAKVENNAVHRLRFGIVRHIRMGIKVNLRPQSACGKQTISHGGATGFEERDTLLELLREIDSDRFQVISTFFHNWKKEPPIPIFIYKYTDSERD